MYGLGHNRYMDQYLLDIEADDTFHRYRSIVKV